MDKQDCEEIKQNAKNSQIKTGAKLHSETEKARNFFNGYLHGIEDLVRCINAE